jgi:hypothetical protein
VPRSLRVRSLQAAGRAAVGCADARGGAGELTTAPGGGSEG